MKPISAHARRQKHRSQLRPEIRVYRNQNSRREHARIRYLRKPAVSILSPASASSLLHFHFHFTQLPASLLTFTLFFKINPFDYRSSIKMQLFVLTTLTLLVAATSAIPTTTPAVESPIEKRTCGTLSSTAFGVC